MKQEQNAGHPAETSLSANKASPAGLVRFVHDRTGAIAVIAALLLPAMVGAVGLASDTIEMTLIRREMQREADSGALAGAFARSQGKPVTPTVTSDLAKNADRTLTVAPLIENAPSSGAYAGSMNAVRVGLATDVRLPFSQLFAHVTRINAYATAAVISNGDYCALALDPTNAVGITMSGNATVDISCGMATDSSAANAVSASGSASIIATPIAAVGGLQPSSNYVQPTVLIPYSVPQPDPFSALPNPVVVGPINNNGSVNPNQTVILSPGNYAGMNLKGTVTLNPGVYYIVSGSLSIGAQANVTGTGVTIILTSSQAAANPSSIATMSVNGGATMKLTAPSTGTYAGVLFYQDRRALDVGTNSVSGNSTSTYRGAMYFPSQPLGFTGNSGMTTDCIQLVARRLVFSGNGKVNNVCPAGSGTQSFKGTRVKLVA